MNKYLESAVVWITGLSGAGKSTLAKKLVQKLKKEGIDVIYLDGDELRQVFGKTQHNQKNYDKEQRIELALKYSKICKLLVNQNKFIIISTISLYSEVHKYNRENLKNYKEIYLEVPIEILKLRNNKNLYSLFEEGKLKNVVGLDLEYDIPLNPDLIVKNIKTNDLDRNINKILKKLTI
jgi:adenylylsulfate kinase-like enzyme